MQACPRAPRWHRHVVWRRDAAALPGLTHDRSRRQGGHGPPSLRAGAGPGRAKQGLGRGSETPLLPPAQPGLQLALIKPHQAPWDASLPAIWEQPENRMKGNRIKPLATRRGQVAGLADAALPPVPPPQRRHLHPLSSPRPGKERLVPGEQHGMRLPGPAGQARPSLLCQQSSRLAKHGPRATERPINQRFPAGWREPRLGLGSSVRDRSLRRGWRPRERPFPKPRTPGSAG